MEILEYLAVFLPEWHVPGFTLMQKQIRNENVKIT